MHRRALSTRAHVAKLCPFPVLVYFALLILVFVPSSQHLRSTSSSLITCSQSSPGRERKLLNPGGPNFRAYGALLGQAWMVTQKPP
jgi:hypothetical protein